MRARQLIITCDLKIKVIDKDSIKLEQFSPQSIELIASIAPGNSIIVEEGVISEDLNDKQNDIINIIDQYTNEYNRIVFNNSNGRADAFLEKCKQYDFKIPSYVVSACSKFINHSEIMFFPEEELLASMAPQKNILTNRTHKFSCLNANKWSHRILTYLHLYDKPYFDDIIFSWGRKTPWTKDFLEYDDFINDIQLTSEEKAKLKNMPERILTDPNDNTTHNDRTPYHNAYTRACLNIITETTSRNDTAQLTEKSFKPLMGGQFFIMVGSKGLIEYMRNIGIDVFDDIVNHSYDKIEDPRERISEVIKEIDRLNDLNLFELHTQCQERFIKNQKWIANDNFIKQFDEIENNITNLYKLEEELL